MAGHSIAHLSRDMKFVFQEPQVLLVLRNLAAKHLKVMDNTLGTMETVMENRNRHWKTLDVKRENLRKFIRVELQEGARNFPQQKSKQKRQVKVLITMLNMIGTEPFLEFFGRFVYTCCEILRKELDRLDREIKISHRRFDERIGGLNTSSQEYLDQLIKYVTTNEARSESFNFFVFWGLLASTQRKAKDLAFLFTTICRRNPLENYLNMSLVDSGQYEVRLSSPASRRASISSRVKSPTQNLPRLSPLRPTRVSPVQNELFGRSPLRHPRIAALRAGKGKQKLRPASLDESVVITDVTDESSDDLRL